MTQPLAGIRVADLSHALAGPFCTHQLQLLGADVVKVEPPGSGDDFRERPAVFAAINAGKRSIVLDLQNGIGQRRACAAGRNIRRARRKLSAGCHANRSALTGSRCRR